MLSGCLVVAFVAVVVATICDLLLLFFASSFSCPKTWVPIATVSRQRETRGREKKMHLPPMLSLRPRR